LCVFVCVRVCVCVCVCVCFSDNGLCVAEEGASYRSWAHNTFSIEWSGKVHHCETVHWWLVPWKGDRGMCGCQVNNE
jgi:hypothetical protein